MKSKRGKRAPSRSKGAYRSLGLPDRLKPGLEIVSIGINPSVYSVVRGFNFARPGNRFWPTFNAARFVPEALDPSRASVLKLLREYRTGFTDIVRRATDRADELTDDDYRHGARALKRKLLRHQPAIAWFQGVNAFRKYLEFAEGTSRTVLPGRQSLRIGATLVFVTPNPSGANPAANPKLLLPWYRKLKDLRDGLRRTRQMTSRPKPAFFRQIKALTPSRARSAARRC